MKSGFTKKLSLTVFVNLIGFILSFVLAFFMPKVLGVDEYGYYQLYILYIGYVAMLHFGVVDGLYLRYGGIEYQDIDRPLFSSQFWLLVGIDFILTLVALGFVFIFPGNADKQYIKVMLSISIVITIPRTMLQYILQCSNLLEKNAMSVFVEKSFILLSTILLLLVKTLTYRALIFCDLAGKTISLLYTIWCCRDIIRTKPCNKKRAIAETKENISVGIKLLMSFIASNLITGFMRFFIENHWGIVTFAKLSLPLSVSNFLMVFVRAIGIVMFPYFCRMSREKIYDLYKNLRLVVITLLFSALVFYEPVAFLLTKWLPAYADGLQYMPILLPICIFESKIAMLIDPFMKTARKENMLMKVNCSMMVISLAVSFLVVYVLNNVTLAVCMITVLHAARCIWLEYCLADGVKKEWNRYIWSDVVMSVFFVASSWFIGGGWASVCYMIGLVIMIFSYRKEIKGLKEFVKGIK